ncbi:MAG: trypsin-like peptidase domain-containing protein [Oligoflexales bacterium]|nr:trypsin-like peptidase domain-containing protein [Oligoflexales bacterium]
MCKFIGYILVFLFLTVGCGDNGSQGKPHNIFGKDDRRDISSSEYPWSSVGRLDFGCTGTLVGKRLVLAAAHCVVDARTGRVREDISFFRPNYRKNESNPSYGIKHFWYGTHSPEDRRDRDWAVLLLDASIGEKYGWMEVSSDNISESLPKTVNIAGYSMDRQYGETLSEHAGCQVLTVAEGGRLLHNCDGSSGISGAALYRMDEARSKAVVLGIATAEYRKGSPGSVVRDEYSPDYANVAIPSSGFYKAVTSLLASVDNGDSAPALEDVFDDENPKYGSFQDGSGSINVRSLPELQANAHRISDVTSQMALIAYSFTVRDAPDLSVMKNMARELYAECEVMNAIGRDLQNNITNNIPFLIVESYGRLVKISGNLAKHLNDNRAKVLRYFPDAEDRMRNYLEGESYLKYLISK